jgi:hypothetical protein
MTFQTTPNMPWIFPDEAIQMNKLGVQSMRPTNISSFQGEVGNLSSWYDDARKEALARVENTQKAKKGMEGKLNTTERSQRYERPMSRSAVPNGVFSGSPMEYVTSAGLRGGVITTKEGQEWLANRLKQRIGEYEAISTGNFSRGAPKQVSTSPYTEVDSLLQQIFAAFGTGSFTSSTATSLSQLLQGFLRIGATIEPTQLGNYARAIQKLAETIRGYKGGEPGLSYDRPNIEGQLIGEAPKPAIYNPAEERLRLVESMKTTLKLIDGVIREIARTINDSQSAREQVMSTLSQRLLGEQISAYKPTFAGEQAQAAVEAVPGVEMGRPSGRTLLGPTFAEEEQARREKEVLIEEGMPQFEGPVGEGKKRRGRPRKH